MADNENSESYHALSIFCQKYDPAAIDTATDKFSSIEIQNMIAKHLGITIELGELHNLLSEMKYVYELEDDQFVWLCQKT